MQYRVMLAVVIISLYCAISYAGRVRLGKIHFQSPRLHWEDGIKSAGGIICNPDNCVNVIVDNRRLTLTGAGSVCVIRDREVILGKEESADLDVGDVVVVAVANEQTPYWLLKVAVMEKALRPPLSQYILYRDVSIDEMPDLLIVSVIFDYDDFDVPHDFARL